MSGSKSSKIMDLAREYVQEYPSRSGYPEQTIMEFAQWVDSGLSGGLINKWRPCPFCSARDIHFTHVERHHPNDREEGWKVECGSCPCELRWFTDEAQALEYWNKRAD